MTSRVYLQRLYSQHTEELYELIDRSREHLRNLGNLYGATRASTNRYLLDRETPPLQARVTDRLFGIRLTSTDELIGGFELRDRGYHEELGYWLTHTHRGHGYMVDVITQQLTESRKPLVAQVYLTNQSSRKVLDRCGFVLVGADDKWFYYSSLMTSEK